jgi:hypothetical protein
MSLGFAVILNITVQDPRKWRRHMGDVLMHNFAPVLVFLGILR